MNLDKYPDVLTPKTTRAILGIGRDKMYELLKTKAIASLRVGRKYLIPKSALLKYLNTPLYTESADVRLNINCQNERSSL